MALAHPGIDLLSKYLKIGLPWKKEFDASKVVGMSFTYEEVKEALNQLKKTDPTLYRLLAWRWQTNRSRNSIANALYLDPSTLKRN